MGHVLQFPTGLLNLAVHWAIWTLELLAGHQALVTFRLHCETVLELCLLRFQCFHSVQCCHFLPLSHSLERFLSFRLRCLAQGLVATFLAAANIVIFTLQAGEDRMICRCDKFSYSSQEGSILISKVSRSFIIDLRKGA